MKHTIRSNEEVNGLFLQAERKAQKNVVLVYDAELPERDQRGRVAYIAGKRLGAAPKRSRAKRLLREAARSEGAPWPGLRVILVARERLLDASFEAIRKDIGRSLALFVGESRTDSNPEDTNQGVVDR